MSEVRFPDIEVQLVGTDGNAYAIMGKVEGALKKNGVPPNEVEEFLNSAMSGDYNNLLRVCSEWVEVY